MQEGKEIASATLKLPGLIDTITRMTGTSEEQLIGRHASSQSRPRTTSNPGNLPKSHSIKPVPMTPTPYTPIRRELAVPVNFGAMFTSLRNDTMTRRLMSRRNVRFAYMKTEEGQDPDKLRLKGRQLRGGSVAHSTTRGQQSTLDSRVDIDLSVQTSKEPSGSSSRLKPRFEENKKKSALSLRL